MEVIFVCGSSSGTSKKVKFFICFKHFQTNCPGAARCGVASQRPHCMTLRADFHRFADFAVPLKESGIRSQTQDDSH